jgi:hypothetical protein
MVSSSTALTVAQVCPRDRNGADSSTPSEQFLPVLLPLQGGYGMRNAVSYIPPTCRKGPGPVSLSIQSSTNHPSPK